MIGSEVAAREWMGLQPEWSAEVEDRIDRLIAMLIEENSRQNLVSAASLAQVWQRHIVDSAQLLRYVSRETNGRWLDLGSGAGFPGLVIAAMWPDLEVIMVESRTKRIAWLESVIASLSLPRARVEGSRLELVETFPAAVISARAFAPLEKLIELSARFSTSATTWVLPKGRSAREELASLHGWQHLFHVEHSLTDPDAGVIVGTLTGKTGKPR